MARRTRYQNDDDYCVRLRLFGDRDLPAALEIERLSFRCPWSRDGFNRLRLHPHMTHRAIELYRHGETALAGYLFWEIGKHSLRLVSLAVHPVFRGQGIGRWALEELQRQLHPDHKSSLVALVDAYNLPAQQWLRACGIPATRTEWLRGHELIRFCLHCERLGCQTSRLEEAR